MVRLCTSFSKTPSSFSRRAPYSDGNETIPPHPFETFCPSTDYSNFEADVIHPAIRAARSRAELSQAPDPGRPVFQHHALLWKRLSNFFSKQTIIILVINFDFLLLFLFQNFLQPFL